MNTCATCGKRHPKVKLVVLDSWLWMKDDGEAVVAQWVGWAKESNARHYKDNPRKPVVRTFTRRVRAGGAVHLVRVAVNQYRFPWHAEVAV